VRELRRADQRRQQVLHGLRNAGGVVMRLLQVELRRALTRRMTRILVLVAILGVALAGVIAAVQSHRGPAPVDPIRQRFFNQCVQAPEGQGPPGAPGSAERRNQCGGILIETGSHEFQLSDLFKRLQGSGAMVAVAMLVLAASLIGAEWRAGTVTTMLTWEPRRLRMMLAKFVAALAIAMMFYVAVQILYGLVLWLVAATRGSTLTGSSFWSDAFGALGRCAGFVGVMTTLGFGLGNLGRNTAAAVGIGFVYTAILENIIAAVWKGARAWLFNINSATLVSGIRLNLGNESFTSQRGNLGHSPGVAGLTLAIYVLVIGGISLSLFRARDVT
jgi:ABC-type transport system involved in multi-copper enzyme maturation permease subunit